MNDHIRLEVIDREGWRKEVTLDRTIVHIGSDPRSDVVLEPARGAGVAPLHAQLIAANSGLGYQLVNLGDTDIVLGSSGDQVLPPRSVTRLAEGLLFKLGEFTLIFHCGDAGPSEAFAGAAGDSRYIGLKLSLPQTRLGPKRSLEGQVTVSNLGDRSGAQFNLDLEGMEPDCFDIEPGPILAAGAMKEVTFRLYHRGDSPMAGDRRIVIRAESPNAYPGEEMTVSQAIEILPLYRHSLRLLSPDRVEPPQVETQPAAVRAAPPPAAAPAPSPQTEDWWTASPAVTKEPKPRVPAAGSAEATRAPQAPAPAPSRATAPAAETKPPAAKGAAPAAPAARVAEPAPVVEVMPAAVEVTPPKAEAAPPPAAEVTSVAPAAAPAPAADVSPPAAEAAPLPAVEEATPPAEVVPPAPVAEQAAAQAPLQSPQAEAAPVPPKKGWARLVQAIPFLRPKQAAPPPDRAEAIVQPPAPPPAMAEAHLLPVAESAPVEEEVPASIVQEAQEQEAPEASLPPETQAWPAEAEAPLLVSDEGETTPAAEPIALAPVQEQAVAEAGPQPEPMPEEHPTGLSGPGDESVKPPEGAPRAEEERPLPSEVAPEETPKKRRALKLKASPPPETKEVWTPPVQPGPAPTEDWWTPQFGPGGTGEEERVLKLKADVPPAEKAEQAPPVEDWWTAEPGSKDVTSTRPVLKLKASLPAEKEPERPPVEAEPPPPTEDWWTAEAGEDAQVPAEKRQVLKLKASPPPEGEAEQTSAEGEPPPAEDWWTP
jgi:hypothetical protein